MTAPPLKLALVVPGFSSGPGDWCIPALTDLARSLAARPGVELHVYALRYPHRRATYRLNGATVHAFGGAAVGGRRLRGASGGLLWASFLAEVSREHGRAPFSLLHGFWATESGYLTALAGRALGVPALVHLAGGELVHDRAIGYGNSGPGISRLLVSLSLRLAAVITVPSSPMRAALLRRYPQHAPKAHDWHFGVRSAEYGVRSDGMLQPSAVSRQPSAAEETTQNSKLKTQNSSLLRTPHSALRTVHVGSLVPVKGQGMMLEGLAWARADVVGGEGPTLTVVGSGPLEAALRAQGEGLGLGEAVSFLGEVGHGELPGLYREHDAFVLASRHETQCMALLEAAACGLPWIAPPVGAVADLARGASASGWLAPQGDTEAMGRAMLAAVDPTERAARGEAARAAVVRDYDLETQTDRLLELYAETVS